MNFPLLFSGIFTYIYTINYYCSYDAGLPAKDFFQTNC